MRAGISRVVVEIIILVIAVALALLIFSPISGYIFGSLGRTATVGGASQIQVLNAQVTNGSLTLDVKNLGPGTPDLSTGFQVYIDGQKLNCSASKTSGNWNVSQTVTLTCSGVTVDKAKQHNIVVYGPGNTQAQYLYYPPPS